MDDKFAKDQQWIAGLTDPSQPKSDVLLPEEADKLLRQLERQYRAFLKMKHAVTQSPSPVAGFAAGWLKQ